MPSAQLGEQARCIRAPAIADHPTIGEAPWQIRFFVGREQEQCELLRIRRRACRPLYHQRRIPAGVERTSIRLRNGRTTMFPRSTLLLTLLTCFAFTPMASAGRFEQKSFMAKSYPGSRDRQYQVFVPSAYTGQSPVPMVMVLHGCNQTETNMINETRFKDLAERDNFIVVYPFISSFDPFPPRAPNCW